MLNVEGLFQFSRGYSGFTVTSAHLRISTSYTNVAFQAVSTITKKAKAC